MARMAGLVLLGIAACAAAASVAPAQPNLTRTTNKAVEPFAECFAAAEDQASRPWSFVPRENGGGTFSNAGLSGVRVPYFLKVADRGAVREIRLEAGSTDAALLRAVDRCI